MTEANLQPSWPSYQSHKQVYYLHSFQEKPLYTYLAMLGATFIGQQGMYPFGGKAVHLPTSEGYLVLHSLVAEFIAVCIQL